MPGIKEQLKSKSVKGVYLLYGEEDFLKDHYSNAIVELCCSDGPVEFNFMKVNSAEIDTEAITEFILSMPFMSDYKVLLLKNTGLLHKANEASKKFWSSLLEELPDYAVVIFCERDVDKRGTLYKLISKSHTAEEFSLRKEQELLTWFANILQKDGKSMAKDDIYFVIENVGRNMYLLKREAEKLISYSLNGPSLIPHEAVEALVSKSLEGKIFELIDNITAGKHKEVIDGIRQLKILREKPVAIVSLLFKQFSNLRKIKAMGNAPVSEIAKKTKLFDFVVRKNIAQLKRFSMDDLDNAIALCNEADTNIKQGLSDPWLTVERLSIKIMGADSD